MKLFIQLLSLLLVSIPLGAHADWFESQGQAPVINDEVEIARNNAVQDALRQALLYAGANVSSVQEISHGLLTSDRFEVRSQGTVRDIQLINERHKNGYVSVTIRTDIMHLANQCNAATLTKTIALTEFPLTDRSQATKGAIFELGQAVARKFQAQINSGAANIAITTLLPLQQQWPQSVQPTITTTSISPFSRLAIANNAQYLVTAKINDISIDQPATKWLGLVNELPLRQFSLEVFLYQGSTGELMWHKQYDTKASWPFNRSAQLDVNANQFWLSPYGQAITNQLTDIYYDLNDRLSCEPTLGQIVKVAANQYTINLGRLHGVNLGDQFKVIHQGSFIDVNGIIRQTQRISEAILQVSQVGQYHLEAKPLNDSTTGGIQIRDTVILK